MEKDHGLLKHQQPSAHNDAVQRYVNAPVENHDVGEMISSNTTQLKRRIVTVFRKSFLTLNF